MLFFGGMIFGIIIGFIVGYVLGRGGPDSANRKFI
jgi:hypothetical protein